MSGDVLLSSTLRRVARAAVVLASGVRVHGRRRRRAETLPNKGTMIHH
jgi:hypothetical protein